MSLTYKLGDKVSHYVDGDVGVIVECHEQTPRMREHYVVRWDGEAGPHAHFHDELIPVLACDLAARLPALDRTAARLLGTLVSLWPDAEPARHGAACVAALEIVFPDVPGASVCERVAAAMLERGQRDALDEQFEQFGPVAPSGECERYASTIATDGKWIVLDGGMPIGERFDSRELADERADVLNATD